MHEPAAAAIAFAAAVAVASPAFAGGFFVQEQSVRGLGRAFSGEAADTGAASLWWNPAAIAGTTTRELSFGAAYINPKGSVNDTGSVIVRPGQAPAGMGGDAAADGPIKNGVLPNVAFAMPLTDRLAFGVSVTSPFSFETNYATDSWARYNATKTRLTTVDIQPTLAFKVNDWLDLGLGLNAEYTKATLGNQMPNLSAALPDGSLLLEGDGWDTGFSAGARAHTGNLVFGLSYKSAVKHQLDGTVNITGLLGPLATANLSQGGVRATFSTPSQLILGVSAQATPQLALHAQVVQFGWSKFDDITLGAPLNEAMPEDYRDTTSVAVGLDYAINRQWTVRAGVQTDPTPTRDDHRDARVPDSDRVDYAIGTSWQVTPTFALDAAYTYVAFDKSRLNYTTAAYYGTAAQTNMVINGAMDDAKANVLIVGGRLSF